MLELIADPIIEAIARLEFEDDLRTGVLLRGCWYPCGGYTLDPLEGVSRG